MGGWGAWGAASREAGAGKGQQPGAGQAGAGSYMPWVSETARLKLVMKTLPCRVTARWGEQDTEQCIDDRQPNAVGKYQVCQP